MIRTMCTVSAALLAFAALPAPAALGAPQCGTSFVEGFDDFSNQGNWVFSGDYMGSMSSGGNPEWHVRSDEFRVSTPHFHTTDPSSVFCGAWRAQDVTSVGIDLIAYAVEPAAAGRPLTLVLYGDTNGTPGDPTDDPFVHLVAGTIPERDGNWRSYTVDVPSASTVLPPGWSVGGPWTGGGDALWNIVMSNVERVAWKLGNPLLELEPTIFRLGADNARLAYGDGPSTYCIAQQNSQGCSPAIIWFGTPSSTQLQPFAIIGTQVLNQSVGMLIYGFGPQETPLFGGYLCITQPLRRTVLLDSDGSAGGPNCTGELYFDFNARIRSGVDPQLVPGATVFAQYWSRDGLAPLGSSLSNALRFTICP